MTYDINASLERLEQNLKNIDSARSQVEKAIMSSNQLQSKMTDFITSMSELLENVNEWKRQLELTQEGGQKTLEESIFKISGDCDAIIDGLGTSVQKINDDLLKSINEWKDDKKASQEQDQKALEESISKINKDCDAIIAGLGASVQKINADLLKSVNEWKDDKKASQEQDQKALEESISKISKDCELIILNLGTSLDNVTKEFTDSTKSSMTLFNDENSKLAEQVEKINLLKTAIANSIGEITSVKSALNSILKELKDSQEAQDKMLMDINTKVTAITPAVKHLIDEMETEAKEAVSKIISGLNETNSLLPQMQEALDKIITKTDEIKVAAGEIHAVTDTIKLSSFNNLTKLNEMSTAQVNANEELLSATKTNRWIIIIGIVLVVILQVVLTKVL